MMSNSPAPWRIIGDRGGVATDDHIVIRASPDHRNQIEASVNGVVVSSRSRNSLRRVLIRSRGGDDHVDVQLGPKNRGITFRIQGGRGDDVITGGAERDILVGGSGDDELNGGGGRDKVRGRAGTDRLNGGDDEVRDILFRDASDILVAALPDLVRADRHGKPPAAISTPNPIIAPDPIIVPDPVITPDPIITPEPGPASTLEEGINRFALDLYAVLAEERAGENLFFSPYSIATALGMLAAGYPKAAETVAALLHQSAPQLSSSFAQLLDRLKANSTVPYELNMANAAWVSQHFSLPQDYLDSLQSDFGAHIERLDFIQKLASAKIINDWVAEQTRGRITRLIDPDFLNHNTKFVLTNAIYFKGQWTSGFDPQHTRSRPFSLPDGTSRNVAMMYQTGRFNYFANDQLQLLELPYKGDVFSMVVLLPRGQSRVSLSASRLSRWLEEAREQQVHVYLPRFEMTNHFSILEPLRQLGLSTQLSEDDSISDIVHQANIEVNEEGTVAAAATAIGAVTTCYCPPPIPPTFNADHPFLYAIRDRRTGGLLFLGHETAPPEAPHDMAVAPAVGASIGSEVLIQLTLDDDVFKAPYLQWPADKLLN